MLSFSEKLFKGAAQLAAAYPYFAHVPGMAAAAAVSWVLGMEATSVNAQASEGCRATTPALGCLYLD